MAASPLQPNVGLKSTAVKASRLSSAATWLNGALINPIESPEDGGFETNVYLDKNFFFTKNLSSCREEMWVNMVQGFEWQHFFVDPTWWWDNGPAWVSSPMKRFGEPELAAEGNIRRLATHADGNLAVKVSISFREAGNITDAVDALDLLVQRRCRVSSNLFHLLLKRCTGHQELFLGRRIHALAVKSGYGGDAFLATHLIGLYASHKRLEEALKVFTEVSVPNAYNWAAIIRAHTRHGEPKQAIQLYWQMCESAVQPNNHIFLAVLQACATARDLSAGKDVHAHILASARKPDIFVQTCLVDMYAKCGNLGDARREFDKLSHRDVVTWNAMITGYSQQGMAQEALSLHNAMQQEGVTQPNSVTYVCLLQACAAIASLPLGKQLHAEIEQRGLQDDLVLGGSLVNMYAKCGSVEDASRVFEKLSRKNVVTWNAMIAGYAQEGLLQEAFSLYNSMQQDDMNEPDSVTYVCLLQACLSVGGGALHHGKHLHAHIKERGLQDVVLGATLVNMYAKCGSIKDAREVFDKLLHKNVVTWTAMISGYAQQGLGQEALTLYRSMQQEGITPPGSVTFVCLLQACANAGVPALHEGKQLHAQIEERGLQDDVVIGGSLVNMYAKCGSIENARRVFDRLAQRNVVTWTAMIAGYTQQGMGEEALDIYRSMRQEGITVPGSVTFVCLMQACATLGAPALHQGKELHAEIEERGLQDDVVLGASLVNLYAKCGCIEEASRVFDRLPEKNVVTWTTMIAGCVHQGLGHEALDIYSKMQQEGMTPPDSVTYACLLQACASVAALPVGKQLHAQIKERKLQADEGVSKGLLNMYAKCGSMVDSQQVFDSLPQRDVVAWGALLAGYTRLGESEAVFDLVDRMRQEGIQPNGVTFLSVLTVCSHVGLVDKGRNYFEAMTQQYGITPTIEHYTCMVDLLGRAGQLNEALEVVMTMPFQSDCTVWVTLLGACRKWKNVEVGRHAFESAVSLDAKHSGAYVLMSNIYAGAGMWGEAKKMQARRVNSGACKEPGQSWWTDQGGTVHTFVVGDKNHPDSEGIYARLKLLVPKMKKEGYVPHLQSSLHDLPDDEKEAELCWHSEKLAIAHALNKTPEGTTIRVVKNLRVCVDCHVATVYISKVEKRTIICRDVSRFHVYKEGQCSCGDYW